ncbi:leucine-rich repeat-containing protein 51 isoform X1 [Microtus pennsylvanicus]|uniref:leucine-rich repeat-containing protein 51 isoform X1 n=1 Tax=Microtus pennsylvanicus TaxID=10058 RepID=UPI003F6ADBDD
MSKRDCLNTSVQEPPLDYSFKSIHVIQDLVSEEPRTGLRPVKHSKSGKSLTQSLWLNNNVLNDLKDFSQVVSQLLQHPENLAWIDLSFNDLTSIDPVLTTFFNLSVLYLHGNSIIRLGEVNKLSVLPRLRSLTLHGNPIEEEKGYRMNLVFPTHSQAPLHSLLSEEIAATGRGGGSPTVGARPQPKSSPQAVCAVQPAPHHHIRLQWSHQGRPHHS